MTPTYDFDCSAFDALRSSPFDSIPEAPSTLPSNLVGRRGSLSRHHCSHDLSSLAGSSYSSYSSMSSYPSQALANCSVPCSYGYFVDSITD
eukprot:scaffold2759_cov57-Cyclotella_meneghiniana.AAC.6